MRSSPLVSRSSIAVGLSFLSCVAAQSVPGASYLLGGGAPGAGQYRLVDDYEPTTFFDKFNFYSSYDPTYGHVQYVNETVAVQNGYATVSQGRAMISVDTTNRWPRGGPGRPAVRIISDNTYTHGLFILDLVHMPWGCGTWPAYWLLGPSWPSHGEMDIIEGVNTQTSDSISLHTSDNCSVAGSGQTANLQTNNCFAELNGNSGCGSTLSNTATPNNYGQGLNNNGGGVYATEWTSSYIKHWFFPRNSIPASITNGAPDSSQFGTPAVNHQGQCDIDSHFGNMSIIINTDFCGAWAGWVYSQFSECPQSQGTNSLDSCVDFVGNNPSSFVDAYWSINSIKVYQMPQAAQSSSTYSTSLSSVTPSASTNTIDHGMGGTTSTLSSSAYTGPLSSTSSSKSSSSSSARTSSSSISTTSTSSAPTSTSVMGRCPATNGTIYSDPVGVQYVILCATSVRPNEFASDTQADFQSCIDACHRRTDQQCVAINFSNSTCYYKAQYSGNSPNSGVRAAVLASVLNAPPSSTMSSGSSTASMSSTSGVSVRSSSASMMSSSQSSDSALPSDYGAPSVTIATSSSDSSSTRARKSTTSSTTASSMDPPNYGDSSSMQSSSSMAPPDYGISSSTQSSTTATPDYGDSSSAEASSVAPPNYGDSSTMSSSSISSSSTIVRTRLSDASQTRRTTRSWTGTGSSSWASSRTRTRTGRTSASSITSSSHIPTRTGDPAPPCPTASSALCASPDSSTTCSSPYGNTYDVSCGIHYEGTIIGTTGIPPMAKRAIEPTFQACQSLCDNTQGCVALNYEGTNCELLSSVTGTSMQPGAYGASIVSYSPPAPTTSQAPAPTSETFTSTLSIPSGATLTVVPTVTVISVVEPSDYQTSRSLGSQYSYPSVTSTSRPSAGGSSIGSPDSGSGDVCLCHTCALTPTVVSGSACSSRSHGGGHTGGHTGTCKLRPGTGTTTLFTTHTITSCGLPVVCPAPGYGVGGHTGHSGATVVTTTNKHGHSVTFTQIPTSTKGHGHEGGHHGGGHHGDGGGPTKIVTTTNKHGHTVTLTKTAGRGHHGGGAGHTKLITTTNKRGHTVTLTKTTIKTQKGGHGGGKGHGHTVTVGGPTGTALPTCPSADGTQFTSSFGMIYEILCGEAFSDETIDTQTQNSLVGCIAACDMYNTMSFMIASPCLGVSWYEEKNVKNCLLKAGTTVVKKKNVASARLKTPYHGPTGGNGTAPGGYGYGGETSVSGTMTKPPRIRTTTIVRGGSTVVDTYITDGSTVLSTHVVGGTTHVKTVTGGGGGGAGGNGGYGPDTATGSGTGAGTGPGGGPGTGYGGGAGTGPGTRPGTAFSTVYGVSTAVSTYVSNGVTHVSTYGVTTAVSYVPITITQTTTTTTISSTERYRYITITLGGGNYITVTLPPVTVTSYVYPSTSKSSFTCRTYATNYLNGYHGKVKRENKRSIFDIDTPLVLGGMDRRPQPGARPKP